MKSAPNPIWWAPRTRLTSSENSKSVVLYVLGVSLFDARVNPLVMVRRVSPGTPSQMLIPTSVGEKTWGLIFGTADRFSVPRKLLTVPAPMRYVSPNTTDWVRKFKFAKEPDSRLLGS